MSAVYHDFSIRLIQWESKEKHLKEENNLLKADSDDCKLQLKRIQEVLDAGDDGDAINQQLVRLGIVSIHTHIVTNICIHTRTTHTYTLLLTCTEKSQFSLISAYEHTSISNLRHGGKFAFTITDI